MGDARILDREGEFALLQPVAATSPDRTGSAVSRTLAVLRTLRQLGPDEHPLATIAARAGLPAPTVHRYLQALAREGAVEQRGPRGHYALTEAPHRSPHFVDEVAAPTTGQTSPAIRAELVTLQSRTGQIALVYLPHLIGTPVRICAERAIGAHGGELLTASKEALQLLWKAPLDTDASGLAILACLEDGAGAHSTLAGIREEGHALSASPLDGRDAVAAPLWRGSVVAGAVTLLASQRQMRNSSTRSRYVNAVMDTAAAMSGRLTRSGGRRAG